MMEQIGSNTIECVSEFPYFGLLIADSGELMLRRELQVLQRHLEQFDVVFLMIPIYPLPQRDSALVFCLYCFMVEPLN